MIGGPDRAEQSPAHQPQAAGHDQRTGRPPSPSNPPVTVAKSSSQTKGEDRGPAEQTAEHPQNDPIRWTDVLVALSAFVSAIFAGVLAWFTCQLIAVGRHQHRAMMKSNVVSRRAIRAAQEANTLGRELGVTEHRAWLKIDNVRFVDPTHITENGAIFRIRYDIENIGSTPATRVWTDAIVFFPHDAESRDNALGQINSAKIRAETAPVGTVIFPTDRQLERTRWDMGADAYNKYVRVREGDGAKVLPFDVLVYVVYMVGGDEQAHATAFLSTTINYWFGTGPIAEGAEMTIAPHGFIAGEVN